MQTKASDTSIVAMIILNAFSWLIYCSDLTARRRWSMEITYIWSACQSYTVPFVAFIGWIINLPLTADGTAFVSGIYSALVVLGHFLHHTACISAPAYSRTDKRANGFVIKRAQSATRCLHEEWEYPTLILLIGSPWEWYKPREWE